MPTCRNGHESEWDDYCSTCGDAFTNTPAAPEPGAEETSPTCSNCGEEHVDGDVFCENCGFDFLSGTLPEQGVDQPAEASSPVGEEQPAVEVVTVEVDLAFFERMGFAGVAAPSVLPEPQRIELPPTDILIGRHSETKGTFPEIDLSSVFGEGSPANDPAVSSNHCRLHRSDEGWFITDLDSTNGTYLGADAEPLKPGVATVLDPGTAIFVGAWTKITISK